MEINIHNYESILIDYFDGNLNALEVAEVLLFLEQHPDIKNEFEGFGTLPEEPKLGIDNQFKLQLKKVQIPETIAQRSFNELIVAQMEGDCSATEHAAIENLIHGNAALIKLKNTFYHTKLQADLSIVYPNKLSLKRKEGLVFYLNRKFAVAAAIMLIASLIFLVYRNSSQNLAPNQVASNSEEVKTFVNEKSKNLGVLESTKPKSIVADSKITLKKKNTNKSENITNLPLINTVATNYDLYNLQTIKIKPTIKLEEQFQKVEINGNIKPIETLAFNLNADEKIVKDDFPTVGNWLKRKLIERGKNNLIENEKPENRQELEIEPITIASVGAGIVEKTTGKKVFFSRSFNKSGTVKSYAFAAGDFKFERIK
jgi:hypothetical protein